METVVASITCKANAKPRRKGWALQADETMIPGTGGFLRETYCNNVGNSEQNQQMKKRLSVRTNHV
jgi:hypothetical protein